MKTKNVTLSDGTKVVLNLTYCEDGYINVGCDIELTEKQADEIAGMEL